MVKKRNYYRYHLKDGKEIVQFGITNSPERREVEHKNERKKFTRLQVVGPSVTKETAERWEENSLATYRRGHKGKNPKYNKTSK